MRRTIYKRQQLRFHQGVLKREQEKAAFKYEVSVKLFQAALL